MIHDWPNVYTFTKCIAENVIENESDGLPVAIYRPTIGNYKSQIIINIFIYLDY